MTNRFAGIMAGRTTDDLVSVLSEPAENWEPEAIEAARQELAKRNVTVERHYRQAQPPPIQRVEEKGGWVRWVFLVAGIAFSLPVPFNLLGADFRNAAGGAVLAAVGIGGFLTIHRARTARAAFIRWLYENADSVQLGAATWEGHSIAPTTTVRTFETAVSMV
jgi:hypothetical protein